jgi:RNA polymerase sigma-70 factor (ECF subfamily)
MAETDEELMTRYCAGDTAAFDMLYRRHRGAVFRYVQRLASAGMDAEALFQDAWLRAIAARSQWRHDQAFLPWLYRIAHNRVIDELRRRHHVDIDDNQPADALPDSKPDQAIAQFWRDCVARLLQMLGRLPEAQRSAFLLREEAGLTLEQIGDVTGVGRETVKSRLRYALQRLRAGLEGCND